VVFLLFCSFKVLSKIKIFVAKNLDYNMKISELSLEKQAFTNSKRKNANKSIEHEKMFLALIFI